MNCSGVYAQFVTNKQHSPTEDELEKWMKMVEVSEEIKKAVIELLKNQKINIQRFNNMVFGYPVVCYALKSETCDNIDLLLTNICQKQKESAEQARNDVLRGLFENIERLDRRL